MAASLVLPMTPALACLYHPSEKNSYSSPPAGTSKHPTLAHIDIVHFEFERIYETPRRSFGRICGSGFIATNRDRLLVGLCCHVVFFEGNFLAVI